MLKKFSAMGFCALAGTFLLATHLVADDVCSEYAEREYAEPEYAEPEYNFCEEECCNQFWGSAEFLYWQIQEAPNAPCLVKEIPQMIENGSASHSEKCHIGRKKLENEWRSGGRFAVGYWFDDCRTFGAEVSYFFLPNKSRQHSVSSNGDLDSKRLVFPFFNVVTEQEAIAGISLPGDFAGKAHLRVSNHMQGAEINGLAVIPCECSTRFGVIAGFRYWNFNDELTFSTSSPNVAPNPIDIYKTSDKFHTQNNFYGGQLGAGYQYTCESFYLGIGGKVALGAMCQKLDIHGRLTTNSFNNSEAVEFFEGGYIALPTNIGNHKKTRFAIIPEFNVNLGYNFTDCISIQLGYTFLYASHVLWAAKQIDRNINPSQSVNIEFDPATVLEGKRSPKAKLKSDSLWAQGLNVGFIFNF